MRGRAETRQVNVGGVRIGGGAPVAIQSMTNTKTADADETIKQIWELAEAGCEIVRVSLPDRASIEALPQIKKAAGLPVVADIHFQSELAVAAIRAGADKVRINPGNIGSAEDVRAVIEAAKEAGVPVRIGVNAGSLPKNIKESSMNPADKLIAGALDNIKLVSDLGFEDIVVSVKSSDVNETVAAYRGLAGQVEYPLHLGITESGTLESGSIKSAVGLGILLADGIGDTLRVSLAADPVHEVKVARRILQAVDVRRFSPEVIACPTCARCEVDLISIAEEVERRVRLVDRPIKIAVMGCVVNGPGEAAAADIGIASGKGKGVIFINGAPEKTVAEKDFVDELMKTIEEFLLDAI